VAAGVGVGVSSQSLLWWDFQPSSARTREAAASMALAKRASELRILA